MDAGQSQHLSATLRHGFTCLIGGVRLTCLACLLRRQLQILPIRRPGEQSVLDNMDGMYQVVPIGLMQCWQIV